MLVHDAQYLVLFNYRPGLTITAILMRRLTFLRYVVNKYFSNPILQAVNGRLEYAPVILTQPLTYRTYFYPVSLRALFDQNAFQPLLLLYGGNLRTLALLFYPDLPDLLGAGPPREVVKAPRPGGRNTRLSAYTRHIGSVLLITLTAKHRPSPRHNDDDDMVRSGGGLRQVGDNRWGGD